MCSVVVVEVQVRGEPLSAFIRVRVREAISPLTQHRLDEALDLAVRPWRVGFGAFVLDAGLAAQLPELPADERRSVVGHDSLDIDLEPAEPAHRVLEEGAGGLAPLVLVNLCVGEPGSIVGGHVDELEALLLRPERSVPGDAMTDPIEASEALDINMKQLSGVIPFVTLRWRSRLEAPEPAQSLTAADPGYRRETDPGQHCDLSNRSTLLAQSDDLSPELRFGRRVRVRPRAAVRQRLILRGAPDPLPPSPITDTGGRRRLVHRPALFGDSFEQQCSTCRAGSRILVHVHPGPPCQPVRLKSFQIDESRPDGQPPSRNNLLTHHS